MKAGNCLGCHQKPERSFFFGNYQCPLCARCTGIFVGEVIGIAMLSYLKDIPYKMNILLMVIMVLDWGLQTLHILESTNIRRLITGFMCGIGLFSVQIKIFYMFF